MNDLLGPMGTATAESLREVGLEPEQPTATRRSVPREMGPPDRPRFALAPAIARAACCVTLIAMVSLPLAVGASEFYRHEVDEPCEAIRQMARYLDASRDVAEKRVQVTEIREHELLEAIRLVAQTQDRLVRAERRARRLAHGRRP